MSKTRARNGDKTKMVFSEISWGGYVIEDDKVELPNYLLHLPSNNDAIAERWNDEKKYYKGDDGRDFNNLTSEVYLET